MGATTSALLKTYFANHPRFAGIDISADLETALNVDYLC